MFKRLRRLSITANDGDSQREGIDDRHIRTEGQLELETSHRSRRNSIRQLVSKIFVQPLARHREAMANVEHNRRRGGLEERESVVVDKKRTGRRRRLSQERIYNEYDDDRDRALPVPPPHTHWYSAPIASPSTFGGSGSGYGSPPPTPSKTLRRISAPSPLRAHPSNNGHAHEHRHSDFGGYAPHANVVHDKAHATANTNSPLPSPGHKPRGLRRTTRISASSVTDNDQQIAAATGIVQATASNGSATRPARRHSNSSACTRPDSRNGDLNGGSPVNVNMKAARAEDKEAQSSHRRTRSSSNHPLPAIPTTVSSTQSSSKLKHQKTEMPRHNSRPTPTADEVSSDLPQPPAPPPKDRKWSSYDIAKPTSPTPRGVVSVTGRVPGVIFRVADHEASTYNMDPEDTMRAPEDILARIWEETTKVHDKNEPSKLRCEGETSS